MVTASAIALAARMLFGMGFVMSSSPSPVDPLSLAGHRAFPL